MTENLAGRGEGLKGLVAKWREIGKKYLGPPLKLKTRDETMVMAGIETAAQAVYVICADQLEAALEAAAPPSTAHNELSLVRLVLSAHQTAYAKFHNGEGRGVIEADQMAIGYASVELAKALATPSPQAPTEQSNAFSPTSAREQSSATASSGHGVEPECSCEKPTPTAAGRCFNCFLPLKGMGRDAQI